MIDYKEKLREFNLKFGHYNGVRTIKPNPDVLGLRRRLVAEEAREFDQAITSMLEAKTDEEYIKNYTNASKELADILYVVFGSCLALDIPIDQIFLEVHRSNMSKSAQKDFAGKTLKGPSYREPNIAKILGFEE